VSTDIQHCQFASTNLNVPNSVTVLQCQALHSKAARKQALKIIIFTNAFLNVKGAEAPQPRELGWDSKPALVQLEQARGPAREEAGGDGVVLPRVINGEVLDAIIAKEADDVVEILCVLAEVVGIDGAGPHGGAAELEDVTADSS